jgi:hypothetical protein
MNTEKIDEGEREQLPSPDHLVMLGILLKLPTFLQQPMLPDLQSIEY